MKRTSLHIDKAILKQNKVSLSGVFFSEVWGDIGNIFPPKKCLCKKHIKILQRANVYNPITYDFSDLLNIKFPHKIKICTVCFFHALLVIILVEACQVIWSHSAHWQGSFVHSLNPAGKEPIPFSSICHIHLESGG